MKYLKTFEEERFMPQEGDYVVMHHEDTVCKITKLYLYDASIEFKVDVNIQGNIINIQLNYENLKRFATPEEIERFKLKIDTDKYNL